MTHWDRKVLLLLLDQACEQLSAPDLNATQRDSLQALLDQYGGKAKSVNASYEDVQRMQGQLAQILGRTSQQT